MAINLSDLTGASTSGDILAEAQSTADFLDSCPLLKNLADPSGATDAKQFTATKQPKALPLIDGDGYCYLPPVSGNYASTPDDSALDITGDITIECDFIVPEFPVTSARALVAKYNTITTSRSYQLNLASNGDVILTLSQDGTYNPSFQAGRDFSSVLSDKTRATVKVTWRQSDGRTQFFIKESDGSFTQVGANATIAATSIYSSGQEVEIGSTNSGTTLIGDSIGVFGARIYASVDGTDKRLDVDFTAPNVRHGDTAFECATGQIVTINQSGNDPATVIKKPVLRFDGVDDFMDGVFGQTIDSGYMFAAFSVLGDGGSDGSGRIFGVYPAGSSDSSTNSSIFSLRNATTTYLSTYIKGNFRALHTGLFDDANGDVLHESLISNGNQVSRVNNADEKTSNVATTTQATDFSISASSAHGNSNTAIDLEYLALFPATLTDEQADAVRSYINNRNNVFLRHHTDGYYFYDPQSLADGAVSSWNGRIVGSDNGDADLLAAQTTSADRPTKSGLSVTFADNTDHLDIPSTTQAGWQIVGTSLGTFAYKVDSDAITELNLLGNLGNTSYRKTGDLYGIILLPESATNRDINEAKRLLTDRGASESATADLNNAWRTRTDIVQFDGGDMSDVTNASRAWQGTNLTSFSTPLPSATNVSNSWNGITSLISFTTELPQSTNCSYAWYNNNSLSSFTTTDIKNCNNFTSAWQNCSSLTQFPSDAKLGTEASNVNFESAWQLSGLTSFSTPLPTAGNCNNAWRQCANLTDFNLDTLPATSLSSAFNNAGVTSWSTELPNATNCQFAWYYSDLRSFSISSLPSATNMKYAWINAPLESFSTSIPVATSFQQSWQTCRQLIDFSADVFSNWDPASIDSGVFNLTWVNCTSLTAQSVENILTSIDTSGKYATSTGLDGGSALADAGIDIDYDVSTGSLTAATLSAIESLNGRGWSVNINNEIIVPNILQLQPAAAYSLRSFDADADPNVVNVRRSSDGQTSDFTASEVSDGTLTDWVNTEYSVYTSDFSADEDGFNAYNGSDTGNIDSIGGRNDSLQYIANSTDNFHFAYRHGLVNFGYSYRISVDVYLPSSNTIIDEVKILNGTSSFNITSGVDNTTTTDQWITIQFEGESIALYNASRFDVAALSGGSQTFAGNGTDTFYVRNIQVTQLTADGHVTTWYDQGGTNHATQTTASSQPKIVDAGTLVTEGGEAALDFDGTDDYFQLTSNVFAEQLEVAVVNHLDEDATNFQRLINLSNGSDDDFMIVKASTNQVNALLLRCQSTQGVNTAPNFGNNLINDQNLIYATSNTSSDSYTVSTDGVSQVSSGTISLGAGNFTKSTIGVRSDLTSTTFAIGTIQEIIVFDTDQSANRSAIENNINDHFDIY